MQKILETLRETPETRQLFAVSLLPIETSGASIFRMSADRPLRHPNSSFRAPGTVFPAVMADDVFAFGLEVCLQAGVKARSVTADSWTPWIDNVDGNRRRARVLRTA